MQCTPHTPRPRPQSAAPTHGPLARARLPYTVSPSTPLSTPPLTPPPHSLKWMPPEPSTTAKVPNIRAEMVTKEAAMNSCAAVGLGSSQKGRGAGGGDAARGARGGAAPNGLAGDAVATGLAAARGVTAQGRHDTGDKAGGVARTSERAPRRPGRAGAERAGACGRPGRGEERRRGRGRGGARDGGGGSRASRAQQPRGWRRQPAAAAARRPGRGRHRAAKRRGGRRAAQASGGASELDETERRHALRVLPCTRPEPP